MSRARSGRLRARCRRPSARWWAARRITYAARRARSRPGPRGRWAMHGNWSRIGQGCHPQVVIRHLRQVKYIVSARTGSGPAPPITPRALLSLLKGSALAWVDDRAPTMGAALAYYTLVLHGTAAADRKVGGGRGVRHRCGARRDPGAFARPARRRWRRRRGGVAARRCSAAGSPRWAWS